MLEILNKSTYKRHVIKLSEVVTLRPMSSIFLSFSIIFQCPPYFCIGFLLPPNLFLSVTKFISFSAAKLVSVIRRICFLWPQNLFPSASESVLFVRKRYFLWLLNLFSLAIEFVFFGYWICYFKTLKPLIVSAPPPPCVK